MSHVAVERFTVEDYRALPEGPPFHQLVEGELILAPSPGSFHQDIAGNVFYLLRQFVAERRLGKVCIAPLDVYLPEDNVFQPDVFFLSNERLSLLRADGVHGAPDLVVEIASPSHGLLETRRKRPIYAKCGVKEEWLIEPTLQQVHQYDFARDSAKPVRLIDSDETLTTPLLPGLALRAADLFVR